MIKTSDNISYTFDAARDPDNVLRQAIGEYDSVLVLGWNKEDVLEARSSTNLKMNEVLWIIEEFKSSFFLFGNRWEMSDEDH